MSQDSIQKISLTGEAETLLIPLYGKAEMSRAGLIISDKKAEEVVGRIDYDFKKLRIPYKLKVFMGLRAAAFDRYAKEFLEDHPDGTVIHLGCGLDSRFLRVDNGRIRWFDLDLPSVIGIKSKLFEETGRYTLISSSVTDFAWIDRVSAQVRGPVFIIAEGLLMYLGEPQVKELFLRLRDSFKPCAFVFDAYSRFSAKCAKYQSSLKQTGAVIRWGTDSPEEIERFGSGISHVKTEYYPDWDLTALSGYHRFMFAFMGRFKTAREAHRVFMFRLS